MGWNYIARGSQGKPWAKRTEAERYQSKSERYAKAQAVVASKRAEKVAAADAQARRIERELASKRNAQAAADKAAARAKAGVAPGGRLNAATGAALGAKHGPTGRPPASAVGPRVLAGPAVAPMPTALGEMWARSASKPKPKV